jgi:hypothetical protein
MRSKLAPMKKVARMLRRHRSLLLNWFRARGQISAGSVEGLNNKAKLTTRKAYGFRSYRCIEIALYHTLGQVPEPKVTHRFCSRPRSLSTHAVATGLSQNPRNATEPILSFGRQLLPFSWGLHRDNLSLHVHVRVLFLELEHVARVESRGEREARLQPDNS